MDVRSVTEFRAVRNNRFEASLAHKKMSRYRQRHFDQGGMSWHMAQGLDRLTRAWLDLVLSQLNLPDSRGLEAFIKLRVQIPEVPPAALNSNGNETFAALPATIRESDKTGNAPVLFSATR